MKHLLLVLTIWIARFVAGLPKLYGIDKDSVSILRKPDLYPAILARRSRILIPRLVRRAGPKAGAGRSNTVGTGIRTTPLEDSPSYKQAAKGRSNPLDLPKQQTGAVATRKEAGSKPHLQQDQQKPLLKGAATKNLNTNTQVSGKQQTNPEPHVKVGSEVKSLQNPKAESRVAGKKQAGESPQAKSKSRNASLLSDDLKAKTNPNAAASSVEGSSRKKQGKPGVTVGRQIVSLDSSSLPKSAKGSLKQGISNGAANPLHKSAKETLKQGAPGGATKSSHNLVKGLSDQGGSSETTKSSQKPAARQENGANKKQGLQKVSTEAQMQQGLRSQKGSPEGQRITKSKSVAAAETTRGAGALQGKASTLNIKGSSVELKHTEQSGKRSGGESIRKPGKDAPPKKRICRRANGDSCDDWDVEQGRPQPDQRTHSTSQAGQSTTSSSPLVPPMITAMSRTGRDYARTNPWSTGTFALGAASAVLGNTAGVTDHCCKEECAKFSSHVLNYCGMSVGVLGAAVGFTGVAIAHHKGKLAKEEQDKKVESLKMKTEGHDAAIEDHGRKMEQTEKKLTQEIKHTKQTLSQVSKRVGIAKLPEDML